MSVAHNYNTSFLVQKKMNGTVFFLNPIADEREAEIRGDSSTGRGNHLIQTITRFSLIQKFLLGAATWH